MGVYFLASGIYAPLHTIGISMQLSVLGHKELFGSLVDKTPEGLIKTPTELTIQDKRKYEMMIKVNLKVRQFGQNKTLHSPGLSHLYRVYQGTLQPGSARFL